MMMNMVMMLGDDYYMIIILVPYHCYYCYYHDHYHHYHHYYHYIVINFHYCYHYYDYPRYYIAMMIMMIKKLLRMCSLSRPDIQNLSIPGQEQPSFKSTGGRSAGVELKPHSFKRT